MTTSWALGAVDRRRASRSVQRIAVDQLERLLHGALELRVVSLDDVGRRVLDLDVGRRRLRSPPPTCRRGYRTRDSAP